MAGLHFDITGDNANFLRKLDEARNGVRSTSKQIEESGVSIEQMFGRLAKGAAAFGAGITAKEIVSNIVRVRGEFQQLEVAFKTMLGSEEQANTLMGQLVNTAAKTPFDLQGVANGAKQLLAYGTSAEDVNGTLVRLGDIAAGLSIPLGDLVYLYGTTMTQGRLFTQDLRQFQGRGIPLADELAKQFGVAKDKVGELVTAGKVGFPEVQKAIEAMTNDGGKFGGLMEAQSKTITGQISNIEDSIATMYNNIGKQSEGFINDALSGVSYLVENYEEIGKTVLELAAVYGAYKAVLISVAAYQSFATGITYSAEIAELSKLIPLKKQSANEDVIAAVASGKLTQAKAEQVIALRTEISAKIQSLQATEAQTKAEYSSAMASYKSATQRMLIAKQNMSIAQSQMQIAIKSGTVDEIAAAKKNAQTASLELNNAAVTKNTTHKSLNIASTNKKTATDALSSMQTGVNTAVQNANTASTNILTVAKTRLTAASRALGLSILANPYVLATAAVVGLGYGIYKLATAETDAEEVIRTTNEALEAQKKHSDDLKSKSSELSGILVNESKSMEERFIAYRQLQRLMPNVFKDMDFETAKRLSNTDAIKLETDEILRQQRIGLKTKVVMSQQKIQGLKNSIIKTNNSGGYAGALKDDLDAAQKELEIYQKTLKDFEDAKKEFEKSKDAPVVQNKSYWETQKKDAQIKLDALTDIEAAGAKGDALKQKIAGYDKKIGSFSTNTSKQDNQAKKLRDKQEKLAGEIKKSIQERKELLIQSEIDIRQQDINLKEEGSEKELAQIKLNYDRKYHEIAKRESELLEKIQKEEKKGWESENPDYEKKGLKFTSKTTSLTPEQREPFDKEYSLAFQKQDKDTKALLDKLLEKYRDFDAQRTAIEKQGNEETAYLQSQRTDANAEEIDRAITVAKEKIKEGVQQINDAQAGATSKDNPFLKNLFGDTSQMAFKDLQNLIDQAKQLQTYLSGNGDSDGITFISPEQLKIIAESPDELDKLKKALDKLLKGEKGNEWDDIFDGFTKGLAKVKSAKGFKELSEGMQDIGESSSKAADMVGGVAGSLSSMFEEMGNTEAADAMSGVQDAMNAISNIGQGFAKGGIVGGIAAAVGEAANFIGKAFAASARHQAALKEIMNETIAQQREYNLLLMQQNLEYEKATTIFGTDAYGKAANAVKVMKEAVADLKEELAGTTEQKKSQSKDALFKKFFGTSNPQAELKKAYAGLADIEIKTGHKKTGLFGWGRGKDIYSSILDVYPQLVDANGKFNKELAGIIINTKTMSDESKNALQNMIDLANQAEEAYDQLNDYFTDIFGDLGSSMTDALVDAFKNGTDAAQSFTDSVSNMLETLAKQMIYSVTLAPMMEKAQKEMVDVMQNTGLSDEQKFSKWTGILDGLVDDAINQQGLANKLMEEYQQAAKDKGFDIFSPDESTSQNSTKRGFGTEMTHEDAGELSGRFTAFQISNEEIKNSMLSILVSVNLLSVSVNSNGITLVEIRNLMISSNSYLEDIAKYTKELIGFKQTIHNIENSAKAMVGK